MLHIIKNLCKHQHKPAHKSYPCKHQQNGNIFIGRFTSSCAKGRDVMEWVLKSKSGPICTMFKIFAFTRVHQVEIFNEFLCYFLGIYISVLKL